MHLALNYKKNQYWDCFNPRKEMNCGFLMEERLVRKKMEKLNLSKYLKEN